MIYNNITEIIGKTPVVKLQKISANLYAKVFVKLENKNPGGSVKDRFALAVINNAEKKSLINKDTIIIEATSGNTGIALAMICAVKSYKLKIVMPESMSIERRNLLKSYGAELVLTPAEKGMNAAIKKAEELYKNHKNAFMSKQFQNPANVKMHQQTTAMEIWEDFNSSLDIFVAGVGTGGTFTGVSKKLKELNPKIKTIAVEPENSAVISGKTAGKHKIQGIGAGFIPEILDKSLIDEIIKVSDNDAFETSRKLAKNEGILSGISAGANVYAALKLASLKENIGKKILTIIPDTGERYLSTELFK